MQQYYSSIGEAVGAANASNAAMAARIASDREAEEEQRSFNLVQHITARQIRHGDVFVLHGHERTADGAAWPVGRHDVHIRFVGGGDAVISADRPLTVTRKVPTA